MKATNTTIYDGQTYREGDEIPDLGGWVATDAEGGVRHYVGQSADVPKLPHYVLTGSTAICADTGDVYMYEKTNDTWYKN